MAENETKVFRPKSLGGLLRLYARNPDAMLFAGGTEIVPHRQRGSGRLLGFPGKVIYLGAVPELARISRSQRFLDIGACLSVSRILSMGRNVLPPVLFLALSGIGTPSIRNLVTLGGNLCASESRGDVRSALHVIDAEIELRSAAGSRWVGVGQLFSRAPDRPLRAGEVLTRVRVPLEDWDLQHFRKVPLDGPGSHGSLCLAAVAHFPKGSLDALRLCFSAPTLPLFRSRELEARLKSVRLPLVPRQLEALVAELREALGASQGEDRQSRYVVATAVRLSHAFLLELNTRSLETR
ncbi:MAG: FAD binding domain-containing protein [Spirochaetales bacterium]|nr:FAD binding domain-containing protein [Spirochaetales bacterium]